MPRIPVHTVDSAPEASRDQLKLLEATYGKVLNIHGEMAHAPAVLEGYAALQRIFVDLGTFDARTREAIALAVANADECAYCQAAHTGGGQMAGLSVEETVAIRRDEVADPKLAALLTLARQYTTKLGHVEDADWETALAAGWTDAQLAELSLHVTINQLTNYFNHFVGTELDLPEAPSL